MAGRWRGRTSTRSRRRRHTDTYPGTRFDRPHSASGCRQTRRCRSPQPPLPTSREAGDTPRASGWC
eukprot:749224-Hanusia_phi.AAC.5